MNPDVKNVRIRSILGHYSDYVSVIGGSSFELFFTDEWCHKSLALPDRLFLRFLGFKISKLDSKTSRN